jgi:hypothetical protein
MMLYTRRSERNEFLLHDDGIGEDANEGPSTSGVSNLAGASGVAQVPPNDNVKKTKAVESDDDELLLVLEDEDVNSVMKQSKPTVTDSNLISI